VYPYQVKKLDTNLQRLTLDAVEYHWRVRHAWVLQHGTPVKGVSVSVWLQPERTRECILDFAYEAFDVYHPPSLPTLAAAVRAAIPAARAEGWDPESRGRPYRFDVP
jgi:hypothetical protein